MTVESPAGFARTGSVPEAKLEPNAIGVAQDTVIGMATAAPAASAGLILAGLAAATAYASGPALIIMALPMIVIANCYRRLNLWNANCGAAFEWVGRVINPYVGFIVGWLMIMGGIIGTVSTTVVLGPSVLSVFGSSSTAIPAEPGHRHRRDRRHAGHRDHRHPYHRPDPGRHGGGRVHDPPRVRHRRPDRGHQSPARHLPHYQGLVQPQRDRRSAAASLRDSWSRCSRIPAGTAPSTSTRRSGTGGSTPARRP